MAVHPAKEAALFSRTTLGHWKYQGAVNMSVWICVRNLFRRGGHFRQGSAVQRRIRESGNVHVSRRHHSAWGNAEGLLHILQESPTARGQAETCAMRRCQNRLVPVLSGPSCRPRRKVSCSIAVPGAYGRPSVPLASRYNCHVPKLPMADDARQVPARALLLQASFCSCLTDAELLSTPAEETSTRWGGLVRQLNLCALIRTTKKG